MSSVCASKFGLCPLFAVALVTAIASAISAAEPRATEPDGPAPTAARPDAEQIAAWIGDLESPAHATRSAAQLALQRAGEAALLPVVAAVRSPNPEVRLRCVDVLRRHAAGDDPALAQAGQSALEALTKNSDMSVARAAESAIAANARERAAAEFAEQQEQLMLGRRGAVVRLRPLGVAKAVGIPAANVRSISIAVVNGKRTIVAQNGDERVEISDGGDDGVKMSISKKVDGKEKKDTFVAKDASELKAKHPEAHKVYEQYAKDGGVKVEAKLWRERLERAEKLAPPKEAKPKAPPVNHTDVPADLPMR